MRRSPRVHGQPDPDSPRLPGLHTWHSVYLVVLGWFVLVVLALAVFGRMFS